jgi:hypothetical protein
MSTALLLFENSAGYDFFQMGCGIDGVLNASTFSDYETEWVDFVKEIYNRIIKNDFIAGQTEYKPEVSKSKVQIYKLKKVNPEISEIFISGIKFP